MTYGIGGLRKMSENRPQRPWLMSEEERAGSIAELLSIMRSLANDFRSQAALMVVLEKKIDMILQAFPENGGIIGHRVYHENKMLEEKDGRKLKSSISASVWSRVSVAVLVLIAIAVWEYTKIHLKA